ncbi:hypothetical protein ACVPOW_13135 [Staphylococcus aureus]
MSDELANVNSFFDMTTHGKTVAVPAIPKLFDYISKRYAKLSLED